jgi:phosphoribosyl-ATP pyrophosphohydrolase
MTEVKEKIKKTVLESRLYKDFSHLTVELLKKQNAKAEAIERANEIIQGEVEELVTELTDQFFHLMLKFMVKKSNT